MSRGPEPGWYPDPQDGTRSRYWDGAQWTERTRRSEPLSAQAQVRDDKRRYDAMMTAKGIGVERRSRPWWWPLIVAYGVVAAISVAGWDADTSSNDSEAAQPVSDDAVASLDSYRWDAPDHWVQMDDASDSGFIEWDIHPNSPTAVGWAFVSVYPVVLDLDSAQEWAHDNAQGMVGDGPFIDSGQVDTPLGPGWLAAVDGVGEWEGTVAAVVVIPHGGSVVYVSAWSNSPQEFRLQNLTDLVESITPR